MFQCDSRSNVFVSQVRSQLQPHDSFASVHGQRITIAATDTSESDIIVDLNSSQTSPPFRHTQLQNASSLLNVKPLNLKVVEKIVI